MKICIATATRAEYGLLRPLMEEIQRDSYFQLQILVTGAHLSAAFGHTFQQIEADGFSIDYKVDMELNSDTAAGITQSMGKGMIGFSAAFTALQPDILVILGDRYEMLALASAALIFKIPVAHLHGGEITEGAYDESIRHAITKLSQLHFTATEPYRKRVIQLGENPNRVFAVGALGIDNIKKLPLRSKEELEKELHLKFKTYNFLIAFHPETLSEKPVKEQFTEVLKAIEQMENSFFIFTKANADTDGSSINALMEAYTLSHPEKSILFSSLGSLNFLSVLKIANAIVGNSSSGIIEAPSLQTPTINIGDRQKGRTDARSILHVATEQKAIYEAMQKVIDPEEIVKLKNIEFPYGAGNTAQKIVEILKKISIKELSIKKFEDLSCNPI